MSLRVQVLILTLLVLASFLLFNILFFKNQDLVKFSRVNQSSLGEKEKLKLSSLANQNDLLSFQNQNLNSGFLKTKKPIRDWNVGDPIIDSQAVLIESLDDNFPFYYHQVYKIWPLASITKFLTAVTVLEDFGLNQKIEINEEMLKNDSKNFFRKGDIYLASDLLKLMVVASNNAAAEVFEVYYGKEKFINHLNEKARKINMLQTKIVDASGLSKENVGTAIDVSRLVRYINEKYPEILNWSRLPSVLIQPLNRMESVLVNNINPLVDNKNYLGGKTGTLLEAKENLAGVFLYNQERLIIIILGSNNRLKEVSNLVNWLDKAYIFEHN